jgi:hypothetical protein
MFSLPDRTAHPTKFADYLELSAICSLSRYCAVKKVLTGFSFEDDEEVEDWADEDSEMESLVASVQEVIAKRMAVIGAAYPFRIDDSGFRLEFSGVIDDTTCLYLFPLILSHSADRTIISEEEAPELTNEVRNWFQSLSTIAAGGFVEGTAVSFGWPRPDKTAFAEALKATYARFGEGKPLEKPRPAAPKRIKDGGIDIIAWKQSIDGLAGKTYLLGQVASGANWREKSVKQDAKLFHKFWFSQSPASEHKSSMFMPFALEPDDPSDTSVGYDELMDDYAEIVTDEFGDVFYRDRLAYFALRGKALIEAGNTEIDGFSAVPQIRLWVTKQFEELSTVRAA